MENHCKNVNIDVRDRNIIVCESVVVSILHGVCYGQRGIVPTKFGHKRNKRKRMARIRCVYIGYTSQWPNSFLTYPQKINTQKSGEKCMNIMCVAC